MLLLLIASTWVLGLVLVTGLCWAARLGDAGAEETRETLRPAAVAPAVGRSVRPAAARPHQLAA